MTEQTEFSPCNDSADNDPKSETEFKVYKRRWIVLVIYILFSISNNLQYIEFSIIADVITDYYQVSYDAVNWSAMIATLVYILVSVPGTYIIDRIGLRKTVIIGIIGTAVGSWIKVGSVHPDRFWLILLGQTFVGIFQICIYPLLPKLSATWFGYNQTSTAVGIGYIGIQGAAALSFIIPPLLVWKGEREDVEKRLYILNISYAALATAVIPIVILFFSDTPPTPPSLAQRNIIKAKITNNKSLLDILKSLMRNKAFIFYILIQGINIGVICSFQVLSNQIILYYYPTATYDVGVIGLLQCFLSLIGSTGISIILDKYKRFKITCWMVYLWFLLSIAFYISTLDQGIAFVYVTSILMGIGMAGIATLSVEVILELTYPEPESIVIGIVTNWIQATCIGFTFLYEHIFSTVSVLWANLTMLILVIAIDLLFFFLNFDLRRKAVQDAKTASDKLAHGSLINSDL